MFHTDMVLSSPEATSLDLSQVIIMPVTEVRLLRLSILWLRVIEKILIFLSYEPVAMWRPSDRSTILVTAA